MESLRAQLSNFTFTVHFPALEREMATPSSVLAWRIPGTGEPGGLPSMGSQSRTRLKRLKQQSAQTQEFLAGIPKRSFNSQTQLLPWCVGTLLFLSE